MNLRLHDLDQEGVWAELVYPSIGIWMSSIRDPELLAAGCRAINDWAFEFQRRSLRHVPTATIPLLTVEHAVAEVERAADIGFKAAYLSVAPPTDEDWNDAMWEPLWSACEETGLVIGYHVGTEPHDASTFHGAYYRGPGGALLNYVETTYGGQRAATKMIATGVFDRHPSLKVIVSEGGATWGPFVADRLDEGYRQHASAGATAAGTPAERVPVRERVRVVPARPLGGGRELGDGLAQRLLGQRLPAPRRDVRPHAEDAARALRRRRRRDPAPHHRRRVRGAVPPRAARARVRG